MAPRDFFADGRGKVSSSNPQIIAMASKCGVSANHLYLVVLGHKAATPRLAAQLEYATGGKIDRRETLPDFPWDAPVTRAA